MTNDAARLAPAEKSAIEVGYLRLSDSAPLIMAQELGLYEKYGLTVTLVREVSWANIRDRLVIGELDAAQMLAPLPLATTLGAGGMRADVITGLTLSLNGNAVTLGEPLSAALRARQASGHDARQSAIALADHLAGEPRAVTLASAHTFSCHTLLLRHWLRAGGVDAARDVNIIVLPPEQMADSLSRGVIDGFCVGEPWNTLAVQRGVGCIQATGYDIWNNSPEKVLGVTESWHQQHPGSHLRLRLALMEACAWLALPENREQAASTLALPQYLNLPLDSLQPSLSGRLVLRKGETPCDLPHFHVFGKFQAGFPWRCDGEHLLREVGAVLGKTFDDERIKSQVQRVFRTDLYREAARHLGLRCPSSDYKGAGDHESAWEREPGIELGANRRLPARNAR